MKRFGLALAAAALFAVNTADAQLSMQMGNGWNATFAGNVNAFWIYGDGGDTYGDYNGIGTGLLPAFFTFDAKGKEGETELGIHIGFAPQVSSGGNVASFFGEQAAGAQIDMRQVYATVGGEWGQILFGKELGLFQRQNILTDMTLFGAGPNSIGRGTALGRIGYGYLYTDFRGQFTYSTPAGKPVKLSVGVFEPISFGEYTYGQSPRFEAEVVFNPTVGGSVEGFSLFASGALQSGKDPIADESETAAGVAGGVKLTIVGLDLTASGFFAKGMGSTFMGNSYLGDGIVEQGVNPDGTLQDSYGFLVQGMYTFPSKKVSLGASYGLNRVDEEDSGVDYSQESLVFQGTYHWTKSLRVVGEFTNYTPLFSPDGADSINQFALGMMLFY